MRSGQGELGDCRDAIDFVAIGIRDCIREIKESPVGVKYIFVSTLTPPGLVAPASKDRRIDGEAILEVNRRIPQVITSEAATLVDLYPLFIGHEAEYISIEGLHLLPDGYQAIADAVHHDQVDRPPDVALLRQPLALTPGPASVRVRGRRRRCGQRRRDRRVGSDSARMAAMAGAGGPVDHRPGGTSARPASHASRQASSILVGLRLHAALVMERRAEAGPARTAPARRKRSGLSSRRPGTAASAAPIGSSLTTGFLNFLTSAAPFLISSGQSRVRGACHVTY